MDAIRKKMQSLKGETDGLYATIQKFEDATKESNRQAEQVRRKVIVKIILAYIYSRLIVTSGILERKSRTLKFHMMKLMTNFKKHQNLWRRRKKCSRKLKLMFALSPGE